MRNLANRIASLSLMATLVQSCASWSVPPMAQTLARDPARLQRLFEEVGVRSPSGVTLIPGGHASKIEYSAYELPTQVALELCVGRKVWMAVEGDTAQDLHARLVATSTL